MQRGCFHPPTSSLPRPCYPAHLKQKECAMSVYPHLEATDPELLAAIKNEVVRQNSTIELIASENFVSRAVLEAQGSVLTNKYAEGLPGARYYGGCEFVDVAENLAIERAKKLFGAEHADVQPHSGSQANMSVYFALLKPGDTIMGMNLAHGGHLTHGAKVSISGKYFNVVPYGVSRDTGRVDMDELHKLALEHKPKLIIAGYSAYPRVLDFARFREIADEAKALLMCDMAHFAGLSAAGEYPNPVPHCHVVTSTTHKTLRGPRGGLVLCKAEYAKKIDKAVFPGIQGGPLMHVIAAKAVAFGEALQPAFKDYARQIITNARAMARVLGERGFHLVSGGTDNHLVLVDLSSKGITGKDAEAALEHVGITVNKNAVPFDEKPPTITSGIRIGTPAMTTRGLNESDAAQVGQWIADVLEAPADEAVANRVRKGVADLLARYPLYTDLT